MDQLTEAQKSKLHSARMAAERRSRMPEWSGIDTQASPFRLPHSKEFTAALGGYAAFLATKEAMAADSPDPAI